MAGVRREVLPSGCHQGWYVDADLKRRFFNVYARTREERLSEVAESIGRRVLLKELCVTGVLRENVEPVKAYGARATTSAPLRDEILSTEDIKSKCAGSL
jgi:hypothetical protein